LSSTLRLRSRLFDVVSILWMIRWCFRAVLVEIKGLRTIV
jgi:hypothetical protein